MFSSPSSLYYLRHTRLCAASPLGSQSTAGCAHGGIASLGKDLHFFLDCFAVVLNLLVRGGALLFYATMVGICVFIDICIRVFSAITPAEIAACWYFAQNLTTWFGAVDLSFSWFTTSLPILLCAAVVMCAYAERHMPTERSCRFLSAAVVYALFPGHVGTVVAFIFPTFGQKRKRDDAVKNTTSATVRKRPATSPGSDRPSLAAIADKRRGSEGASAEKPPNTTSATVRKRLATSPGSDRRSLAAVADKRRGSKRASAEKPPQGSTCRAKRVSKHSPCKNGCRNKHGKPKQAISGCAGYCWACYRSAHPESTSQKVRRTLCCICGPKTGRFSQKTLDGKRYCKVCFRDADASCRRCFACFTVSDPLASYSCGRAGACAGSVWLCENCKALKEETLCPLCWVDGLCYCCGEPLDQGDVLRNRFCKACSPTPCVVCSAMYVHGGQDVRLRQCAFSTSCSRGVYMCDDCAALPGGISCEVC